MRIALDARTIQDHFPGIGRYTFNLVLALADVAPQDELFLLYDPLQHNTRFDLDLLRAGGSDTPESLAKIVGLDLSDPGFWADGLDAVDQLLAEAESLAEESGRA